MIGRTIAHYKILEKLGEGGMGHVYLAEDTELGRRVALKVLRADTASDEEMLGRFRREARAVAALNHPNIVTIHSVEAASFEHGEDQEPVHFLTMELVEGVGLDHKIPAEGLPQDRIFELAIPLADALSAAHKEGITHRDLKPANVMLTTDDRVKILDFGLAKLAKDDASDQDTTQALTQAGMVIGTVPYMSPEQVSGRPVDHRTDIFALGVILYEMATGRRPFAGESSGLLISSILRDDPPSVTELRQELPFHLGRIVRRCLEKEPDRRYQAALDVRNELEALREELRSGVVSAVSEAVPAATPPPAKRPAWLIAGVPIVLVVVATLAWLGLRTRDDAPVGRGEPAAAAAVNSVVVLPFENLGPPEDEYFAAGITDEITNRLATIEGMRVISRNSASRYAKSDKSLQQIGTELGVGHVLEGSVRWAKGDDSSRVRITPRLTRVEDDAQIWSQSYDRVFEDVFEVESEIADSVTQNLGLTLLEPSEEERPTQSAEAYQAYLKALDHRGGGTVDERQLSIDMFVRATELDPEFAEAWAYLAWTYAQRYFNGDFRQDWGPMAEEAITQARTLDPDNPLVQLADGFYWYYMHREFDRALEIFRQVVRANPNDVDALSAVAYIHRRQGRFEETIQELEKASALDPQNIDFRTAIAETYGAMRRFDEAIEGLDRALAIAPDRADLYFMKSSALITSTGATAEARAVLERAPGSPDIYQPWIVLDWLDRDFDGALERLEAQQPKNAFDQLNIPIQIGFSLLLKGDDEAARPYLEQSLAALEAVGDTGQDSSVRSARAVLYAALGQPEAALEEIDQAIELTASDRFSGPQAVESKALVHAMVGQSDAAIDLLEQLLEQSYLEPITRAALRTLPFWDPLRSNPRFEALLQES